MGFGTDFQGKKSHETLLQLQEQEIKLLENIKRCLQVRIKSDKSYADSLSSLVKEAQKFNSPDFLPYCSVFQAWDTIVKQTDKFVEYLNTNVKNLTSTTMTRLSDLINDKKAAKKFYFDERNRLECEFSKVQDEAQRHKAEYSRSVAKMSTDEAKYNDSKSKGGKKLEEAKSKYHKSASKLHRVHNDYVLSLREVMSHQDCYLRQTLPTLLDYHQATQENFVKQCKDILQEYHDLTNVTNTECCEIFKAAEEAVEKIAPEKEYSSEDFVKAYCSDPIEEFSIAFSQALLSDYNGSLKPDVIAVDNLTHDDLVRRKDDLADTESQMESAMNEKQENYNLAQEQLKQFGPSKQTDREYLDQKQEVAKLRYELNDEQCKVCVKQHLLKVVTEALDKAGNDLPDVLDFSIDSDRQEDTSTISSSSNHHTSALGGGLKKIKSLGGAFTKRSKSTVDEKSTVSSYEDNEISQSSNGPVLEAAAASRDSRPEFQSNGSLPLEEEEWFHGVLPREEVQRLLCNDGDFLVRESKNRKTNETQYVLSAFWQGHRHFIIQYTDHEGWRFEGRPFPTIGELVRHQHRSGDPVTTKSKTILKCPIVREQWQLRNDDISLEMKIGNGNFGEVYKGVYKPKNMVVAVKTCRDTLSDDQRKKFLQEGRILKQYDHENIVRFIGIAAQRQPVMIVMEYVAGGALLGFLRKNGKAQTKKQLAKMCEDAASGMAYLESKNCIHRDLAARNCLVGDQNVVKISDFGMSREEEEYTVSDGLKQIPIKWTAPEALLYGKYTSLCDVWSFGILMWEVFSSGQTPYPGQTNNQAREKIDAGYRMPAPEGTPPTCYDLMLKCWEKNPADRPHFASIVKELKSICKKL